MKSLVKKDKKLRKKVASEETSKIVNKFLFINLLNSKKLDLSKKKKIGGFLIKDLTSRNSKTKIVRRCVLTGRSRVSNRILGISRIKLKDMLKNEIIPGFSKAIW